jgi:geranylgeranyl pyrophosphate synthase
MSERGQFSGPVRPELDAVERRLRSLLADLEDENLPGELRARFARYVRPAVGHLFQRQGKLLRPYLVLLSARAAGARGPGREAALVHAAAAIELIHTASLAHDDMIDSSPERRGAASLHVAHGSTTAILVGDLLYARFFQELAALPGAPAALRLRLLEVFLGVTRKMCEGEILADQMRLDGTALSPGAYLHIAEAKTAELLSACCFAGGLLGGASEAVVTALAGYGRALGLLFQIADDLADGDCACADRSALAASADECRLSIGTFLEALPDTEARVALRSLPDCVLSPSRH